MKQGPILNKIIMLIFAAAVMVYFVVSAITSLSDPFSTTISYAYTVDTTIEVTGILVREEHILPSAIGSIELLPDEGERVANGQAVAVIYQNEAALARNEEIQSLTTGLAQLEYALLQDGTQQDSAKLSGEIVDAMIDLQAATATGDFSDLEDQTFLLKSLVYEREYAYGDEASADSLATAIAEKSAQIQALQSQSTSDTSYVWSDSSGIFSGEVDGYESILTPELLPSMTPSQLAQLMEASISDSSNAVGKLITDSTWHFALTLSEEESKSLYEGFSVLVRFSHDWSGEVDMEVTSVSSPDDGQVLVVLSSNRSLSNITLLREQTVELVFGTVTGVRVPKEALRVLQVDSTNDEGEVVTTQVTGVYALVGEQAEFKPANILLEDDSYCLLDPVTPSNAKTILRAGDEIIVAASDLYDGKVIE